MAARVAEEVARGLVNHCYLQRAGVPDHRWVSAFAKVGRLDMSGRHKGAICALAGVSSLSGHFDVFISSTQDTVTV